MGAVRFTTKEAIVETSRRFDAMDTDHNGKVTPEEFIVFQTKQNEDYCSKLRGGCPAGEPAAAAKSGAHNIFGEAKEFNKKDFLVKYFEGSALEKPIDDVLKEEAEKEKAQGQKLDVRQ